MTYSPEQYLANKERHRAYMKRYYLKTRVAHLTYQKSYDGENREQIRAQKRKPKSEPNKSESELN